MVLKKKKIDKDNKEKDLKDSNKKTKKRTKKPAEGSRYAALVLLFITIIISVGFYLYGLWSSKGVKIEIDLGEVNSTWEYSK